MSDVVHRRTGEVQFSVNTPDYPPEDWLINPTGLRELVVRRVPTKYWVQEKGAVREMSPEERAAVDSMPEAVAAAQASRRALLAQQAEAFIEERYSPAEQRAYLQIALRAAGDGKARVDAFHDWAGTVYGELARQLDAVDGASTVPEVEAVQLQLQPLEAADPKVTLQDVKRAQASEVGEVVTSASLSRP